jgi:RimJ/RimL family protein N-acetyltransferase
MTEINSDSVVMEYFPSTYSKEETIAFIERMKEQYNVKGYCYYAVDKLESQTFIGFIGLSVTSFESDFTPCVDIGWRLQRTEWGKGFASEGARTCLSYGFTLPGIERIYSFAPLVNKRSIHIMEKLGMKKLEKFMHPKLIANERLAECALYVATRSE